METLGARIKRLRTAKGLSQEALGSLCEVSRVAVTKWENGDTENIKLANLKKLCTVFRISVAELIDATDPGQPLALAEPTKISEYGAAVVPMPTDTPLRKELASLIEKISDRGLILLVESAEQLVSRFPKAKANHVS